MGGKYGHNTDNCHKKTQMKLTSQVEKKFPNYEQLKALSMLLIDTNTVAIMDRLPSIGCHGPVNSYCGNIESLV